MPWWRSLESGEAVAEQTMGNSESVTVPLLTLLQDISRQMRETRTDISKEIVDLKLEVQHANAAITTRVKAVEDWRIGHDMGGYHQAIDKRLDGLDASVKTLTQDAEARKVQEKEREEKEKEDRATSDRRANLRLTIGLILATLLGGSVAYLGPLLTAHH